MAFFEFLESLLGGSRSSQNTRDSDSVYKIAALLEGLPPERSRYLAAFAYLMARVAVADFVVSPEELKSMVSTLETQAGLPAQQAQAVAELARTQALREGSTDDFLVTRELRQIATRDELLQILDCLFAVAAAQHAISVTEDNAIRQIASELLLEHHEFISVRTRYRDQLEVLQMGAPNLRPQEGQA